MKLLALTAAAFIAAGWALSRATFDIHGELCPCGVA